MAQQKDEIWKRFSAEMIKRRPRHTAQVLEDVDREAVAGWVTREDPADAVRVLENLGTAAEVLEHLDPERAASLVEIAELRAAGHWLARIAPDHRARVVAEVSAARNKELAELMGYPDDSAGRLMDPSFTSFSEDALVRDVTRRIKTLRTRRIHDVMLVDTQGRLVATVRLQDIALAPTGQRVRELAASPTWSVQDTSPRDEVLRVFHESRASSVPVVNYEGLLVGVLRQDELMQAATTVAADKLLSMVGAGQDERSLARPILSIRKRLPWLLINLLTAFLAAAVVGIFEDTIATYTALAILLPVVAGQSGNTGAQAQAVTLRGLALREIRLRHWLRVASKEMLVGTINGVAIAVSTAVAVYVWNRSLGLSVVIATSMVLSMMAASLAGAMIPMILTKLRQDPAAASSIILTTVTDVVGFLSFLGIATLLRTWL